MQGKFRSMRPLNSKRKQSIKSIESIRKNRKLQNKSIEKTKKMIMIIKQFEDTLQLLKTFYQSQILKKQKICNHLLIVKNNRPYSQKSKNNNKIHQQQIIEQQTTTLCGPQLEDLKKSFVSVYGYSSNNIVELYNFYKKNCQKSTKLFASTSMSNMINLTQNQSEIRDKVSKGNVIISNDKVGKQNKNQTKSCFQSEDTVKLPTINIQNVPKKSNQMVNVASLLAEKRRISKKNICANINSENLMNQAKKKLYRPLPIDHIQKLDKIKQNLRQTTSNKKIKEVRQKSNSKKDSAIKASNELKQQTMKISDFAIQEKNTVAAKLIEEQKVKDKSIQLSRIQQFKGEITAFQLQPNSKQKLLKQNKIMEEKNVQITEIKGTKSPGQLHQIKSQNSKKSSQFLNQGILMDLTGSGIQQTSNKKSSHKTYFVPRVHTNHLDSLLDCQITLKQQSKIFDLESIPFDF